MSEKNIFDDDFEIEFVDDENDDKNDTNNTSANTTENENDNTDENEEFRLEEIEEFEDGEEGYFADEYEVGDYDEEEPMEDREEDGSGKRKLTKNQIVNRVMAGMGIAIAGFTIFYGCLVYGFFHKDTPDTVQETETTTVVIEETTTEPIDEDLFVSPYSDTNISEDVKKLLNNADLDSMSTGLYKLDNRVKNVISKIETDSSMSTYEKVRAVYDYVLYYFEPATKLYVDEDTVYETCSSVDYISYFDMELIYRANRALTNQTGASAEYACVMTVLLREIGLEAYYIDGEKKMDTGYESHGYTLVLIDGEQYVFDAESEDKEIENAEVSYSYFCKKWEDVSDVYSEEGIEESMDEFKEFKTLGEFSFRATISAENGDSASGSVRYEKGYSEDGNAITADGDIEIYLDEKIYLSGSVSGSSRNTWKLIAKVYDDDMNYITESVLYNTTTDSSKNEISYSPGRAGMVRLVYMVTDSNGRTCTISKLITVKSRYEETSTVEEEPDSTKETESTEETTDESEKNTEESSNPTKQTTTEPITTTEKNTTTDSSEETTTLPSEDETTTPFVEAD